jgi:hypothetical protein
VRQVGRLERWTAVVEEAHGAGDDRVGVGYRRAQLVDGETELVEHATLRAATWRAPHDVARQGQRLLGATLVDAVDLGERRVRPAAVGRLERATGAIERFGDAVAQEERLVEDVPYRVDREEELREHDGDPAADERVDEALEGDGLPGRVQRDDEDRRRSRLIAKQGGRRRRRW